MNKVLLVPTGSVCLYLSWAALSSSKADELSHIDQLVFKVENLSHTVLHS